MSECKLCPSPVGRRNRTGLCRSCAAKNRLPGTPGVKPWNCLDCSKPISRNRTHRCASCATIHFNSLPETRELRRQTWARRLKEPGVREALAKTVRRNFEKAMTDPDKFRAAQERGSDLYRRFLCTPEVQAKIAAARADTARKVSEHHLGWCPLEFRKLHQLNMRTRHMTAAESRELIERMVRDRDVIRSGELADALFWLRRILPISLNEDGTYQYGSGRLWPSQIVDRAKLKGWNPERMAA